MGASAHCVAGCCNRSGVLQGSQRGSLLVKDGAALMILLLVEVRLEDREMLIVNIEQITKIWVHHFETRDKWR